MLNENIFYDPDYVEGEKLDGDVVSGIYRKVADRVYELEVISNYNSDNKEVSYFISDTFEASDSYGLYVKDTKSITHNSRYLMKVKGSDSLFVADNKYAYLVLEYLSITPNEVDADDDQMDSLLKYEHESYKLSTIDIKKDEISIIPYKDKEYYAVFKKAPSIVLMEITLDRITLDDLFSINRLHYPNGIHPYLAGKGIATRIFYELAKTLQIVASGKSSRSNSANAFWNKMKTEGDFEYLRTKEFDFLLYKKGNNYEELKGYIKIYY